MPVREARWRKRLQNQKPQFVLAGAIHLPTLKRMIPYRAAVDLSGRTLMERARGRIKPELTRLRYRAIKAKRKRRAKKLRKTLKHARK